MGEQKIQEALSILQLVGMPRAQLNERSALTLLALLDLKPEGQWADIERPMIGVTPIMDWAREQYGKDYAPNTRETFRRQTLHQFVSAGLVMYNPDKPDRPVNSPNACYQIEKSFCETLKMFGREGWMATMGVFLADQKSLVSRYAKEREMVKIPLVVNDSQTIYLSAGEHSQLIKDIIEEFGPRFAPGADLIYVGDTGSKEGYFKRDQLQALGVIVDNHGKMPDVVMYWPERNWLLLIESVTSHGPVDGKRHDELATLFKNSSAGLVYVTAFPNRKIMNKYLSEIAWETEVWVADAPTHMIHFNGDRFLGPHS